PGGAESEGAESWGAEPRGTASSGGPAGASPLLSPRPEPLSSQQLREWFPRPTRLRSGATGARDSAAGDTGAGGVGATRLGSAGVTAGASGNRGAAAARPRGARTRETGAAGTNSVRGAGAGGAGAGDPAELGAGAGNTGAVGAGVGGIGAGGAGDGGAGAVDPGAGGAGAGGAVSGGTGAGGIVRPRPCFVPLLRLVLSLPSSTGLLPSLLSPPPRPSQPQLQPGSPLRVVVGFLVRVLLLSPSPTLWHFVLPLFHCVFICCLLLSRLFLPESDLTHAASPTVSRLLATIVTDPSFESSAASTLVAELVDFAAACRLDYATAFETKSKYASPPSVKGECALGTDVLEDRHEDFECLAGAVPHLVAMLLAPEGNSDAPDIPTPRSYADAITCPYSSQW
ncbi:unnamed protein product, partial [Closterium sp. NIES-54]